MYPSSADGIHPSKRAWRRAVKSEVDKHDLPQRARKTLLERVKKAATEKTVISARVYDEERDWFENAVAQSSIDPFHAIVASEARSSEGNVVCVEDLVEAAQHELWVVPRDAYIEKTEARTSGHVRMLLMNSRQVLLVDSHFDPTKERYRRIMRGCLLVASRGHELVKAEIHCVDRDDKGSAAYFKDACEKKLPPYIPRGLQVRVVRWREEDGEQRFHARYLLTERGGYRFDYGLDEMPKVEHDVSLLDDPVWTRAQTDCSDTGTFEMADECVVVGTLAV